MLAGRLPSAQLQRASLPLTDIETCRAPRRGMVPDIERLIGPSQICAGLKGGTADACQGDSGGPLFVRGSTGSVVQVGVVSIGPDCVGTVMGYGSYASVAAAAAGWIAAQVPEASFTQGETRPVDAPQQVAQPPSGPTAPTPARVDDLAGSLGTTPGTDPGRTAQVAIDIREGTRLRIGATASFRVVSSVSGLLVVLVRDPAGRWTQFFPNDGTNRPSPTQAASPTRVGQALPVIRAGQTMVLAGPGDSVDAVVEPPAGQGLLLALVVPVTEASARLIAGHIGTNSIADAASYLAALGGAVQTARAMTPERLPVTAAMGERRFTVLP